MPHVFAIIETGGKQYRVTVGERLRVEKLPHEPGGTCTFDRVLLRVSGERTEVGTPYLKDPVAAKVISNGRHKKQIVFRYHPKTRYRKKKGHRQPYTEVEITRI